MIFEKAKNTSEQGDIGESRAIFEYTRLGYVVSKPLNNKAKYDLIIDDGSELKRVQVKTTRKKAQHSGFEVKIASAYANRNKSNARLRNDNDYDILFVLTASDETWSIPAQALGDSRSSIIVGTKKYQPYRI
jgi:hypothetical protein